MFLFPLESHDLHPLHRNWKAVSMSVPIFAPFPASFPLLLFIHSRCELFSYGMATRSRVAVNVHLRLATGSGLFGSWRLCHSVSRAGLRVGRASMGTAEAWSPDVTLREGQLPDCRSGHALLPQALSPEQQAWPPQEAAQPSNGGWLASLFQSCISAFELSRLCPTVGKRTAATGIKAT